MKHYGWEYETLIDLWGGFCNWTIFIPELIRLTPYVSNPIICALAIKEIQSLNHIS
jgi:hypothetical protein